MHVSSAFKIAKETARAKGEKYFDSGKLCKYGHESLRLVSTGRCKTCHYAENRARSLRRSRATLPSPTRPCPDKCELCGKAPTKHSLHLDHDHQTGKFRGWLCGQCNSSIGQLGDNVLGLKNAVQYLQKNTSSSFLPTDAAARKQIPIASGVFDYFSSALLEVAKVSYQGNLQHNGPTAPLHWARGKSTDQSDTMIRHFMERGTFDSDGVRHSAKMVWRALAILQLELEAEGAPMARGARVDKEEGK